MQRHDSMSLAQVIASVGRAPFGMVVKPGKTRKDGKPRKDALPAELRQLVSWSVAILGVVIRRELGNEKYDRIESIRRRMAILRDSSETKSRRILAETLALFEKTGKAERIEIAHAYTLMLETMNACENAYRTYRLRRQLRIVHEPRPQAVVYVLTAHPTESRSPANILVFHRIQETLTDALLGIREEYREKLEHLLEVAWRLSVSRRRKPKVEDEAEHIYSILLRTEILEALLKSNAQVAPLFVRTWVGGDKDGHPGVDETVTLKSLELSRARLLDFVEAKLGEVGDVLELVDREGIPGRSPKDVLGRARKIGLEAAGLKKLRANDGARTSRLRRSIGALAREYRACFGSIHPAIEELERLIRIFPGLVVPLELREASDVIVEWNPAKPERLAIARMLALIERISRGGRPQWYARGLIVSMASTSEQIRTACSIVRHRLGGLSIPVIPLFEQRESLENSSVIVRGMLEDPEILRCVRECSGGLFEVMLGYSDSAKESGVLESRVLIEKCMRELDRLLRGRKLIPVFFHGSGGSVDRGGGSVEEQTAWWPKSALEIFKATIQGEMVERTLASPEILRRQLERISQRYREAAEPGPVPEDVVRFARQVSRLYKQKIASEGFLELVEHATPYPFLSVLRIGSRPVRRKSVFSVSSLRAIPWVLCWTQTRVLFPTWWGVGSAWRRLSREERGRLRGAFASSPLFRSYVKLLGFTLAKVELSIWRVYLQESGFGHERVNRVYEEFRAEYEAAVEFCRKTSGESELLWFRPWLGTSIHLRSPMIHPLNLLQVLAFRDDDIALLRETVTGIASGMMTTG